MAEQVKTRKKTFKAHDMINCRSFTNGLYTFQGKKSNIIYEWLTYGDERDVEYQDLLFEVHARKPSVTKPRIIVLDEEFLKQNPSLQELYDSMYTTKDLAEILELPVSQMEKAINDLPDGAKDSFKSIVSTKIHNGSLDSIRTIKKLDEIFGTDMLMMLASE